MNVRPAWRFCERSHHGNDVVEMLIVDATAEQVSIYFCVVRVIQADQELGDWPRAAALVLDANVNEPV